MLTASQCRTVAYYTEDGITCPDCARKQYGEHTIDRVDEGLTVGAEISPLSAYELSTYNGESCYASEDEEHDSEACSGDDCPYRETCGACGAELDDSANSSWV